LLPFSPPNPFHTVSRQSLSYCNLCKVCDRFGIGLICIWLYKRPAYKYADLVPNPPVNYGCVYAMDVGLRLACGIFHRRACMFLGLPHGLKADSISGKNSKSSLFFIHKPIPFQVKPHDQSLLFFHLWELVSILCACMRACARAGEKEKLRGVSFWSWGIQISQEPQQFE
jgi:hypothetical protein